MADKPRAIERVSEWKTGEFAHKLSPADQRLASALASTSAPLQVDQLLTGLRVHATSWVGVVQFEGLELRVIPKLVGEELGVLAMLDYARGYRAVQRNDGLRSLKAEGSNFIDLIAWLLADECERIMRGGLLQDYVSRDEALPILRGRLRLLDQMRYRHGWVTPLECSYDDLLTDVTENRWLGAGLTVALRVCRHEVVRRRVAILHGLFDEACRVSSFDLGDLGTFEYHRRNEHYRAGHGWARLLLEGMAVSDLYAPGPSHSFAFLIDMDVVFEQFVTQLLRDEFAGSDVRVRAQVQDSSLIFNDRTGRPYASLRPDVVLEREVAGVVRRLPVDAKYKLYDQRKVDGGDLYQTLLYGQAYQQNDRLGDAFLLYPSGLDQNAPTPIAFRGRDGTKRGRVHVHPIAVPSVLRDIRQGGHASVDRALRAELDSSLTPLRRQQRSVGIGALGA